MNKLSLLLNAMIKFACGLLLVGLMLFIPAGTLRYPNAWLFAGLLFLPMLIVMIPHVGINKVVSISYRVKSCRVCVSTILVNEG